MTKKNKSKKKKKKKSDPFAPKKADSNNYSALSCSCLEAMARNPLGSFEVIAQATYTSA